MSVWRVCLCVACARRLVRVSSLHCDSDERDDRGPTCHCEFTFVVNLNDLDQPDHDPVTASTTQYGTNVTKQ